MTSSKILVSRFEKLNSTIFLSDSKYHYSVYIVYVYVFFYWSNIPFGLKCKYTNVYSFNVCGFLFLSTNRVYRLNVM